MTVPESSSQHALNSSDDGPSPTKKPRTSNANVPVSTRKYPPKGKLSLLMKMPMDILFAVLERLLPLDLLYISRSSKHLRSILMSKTSRPVWKSSLENVPMYQNMKLPEPLADLSEPAYASLVFENWCLFCMKLALYFDLTRRERICKNCSKKKRAASGKGLVDFIETCKISYASLDEVRAMYDLVPLSRYNGRFSPAVAQDVYKKCVARKNQLSGPAFGEYLAGRQAVMASIRESGHDKLVDDWHSYYKISLYKERGTPEERKKADLQAKSERAETIQTKLGELGWTPEDFPAPDSACYGTWKKIHDQAKPVTDRIWTSLKPVLQDLLTREKALRVGGAELGDAA